VNRLASKPGRLDFDEFCVNFLGLPPGFFKMNLAESATDADGASEEMPKGAKPPLPKGTDMGKVQDMFVRKMRTRLFDTETGIREGLFKSTRSMKFISRADMWNMYRAHDIMLSGAQVEEIFRYFDHDEDGRIDYSEMCHEILGLSKPAHVRHKVGHGNEPKLTPNGKKLVQRLREKLERASAHPRKLYQIFRTFDTDGSGEIALDEFSGMVEELGLKVEGKNSPAELLDRFDKNGQGSLSYTEFVTNVLGLRADHLCDQEGEVRRPSSPEVLQAVSSGIKSKLAGSKSCLKKAFRFFDKDNSDRITRKEFYDGCKAVGVPITKEQAYEMFHLYDTDGGGWLSLEELSNAVLNPTNYTAQAKELKVTIYVIYASSSP